MICHKCIKGGDSKRTAIKNTYYFIPVHKND